jgi:hypothetical protein
MADANSSGATAPSSDPNDPSYWRYLQNEAVGDPLKQIRGAADKWVTLLSGLVGVSTVVGLVGGRDAIDKLPTVGAWSLFAMFVATLAVAVVAIYQAALAAEGTPGDGAVGDKADFSRWYKGAVQRAAGKLTLSRWLAVVSILLLAATLGVAWLWPAQGGPASGQVKVLVVSRSGVAHCGSLAARNDGTVFLMSNGQTIALNDIDSVTVVSACPTGTTRPAS